MVQLHRDIAKIHDKGAELYVIGNGAPMFMEGFRETTGWTGPLYTDPSLEVYKAAELKRGMTTVLNPRAILPTLSAFARGNRQGRTQGDAWQQGGVVVIAPSGDVKWQQASDRPGDNASAAEIAAAL